MRMHCAIRLTAATVLAVAAACSGQAAEPVLKVGDPAPKMKTGKWIQGEPVKEFQKDKAYLVEFWATWCGPCKVTIPHLNDLHKEFKDKGLVVIGQNCWEREESKVEPFVKEMGDKMTYRVALDDKTSDENGAMAVTWMEAAGRSGIPSAFLVDKQGKIVWIGHPMQLESTVVSQVLEGKFDVKKAAAEYEEREANQAKLMALSRQMGQHVQKKEWDEAEKTLKQVEALLPPGERAGVTLARFGLALQKGDHASAFKQAREVSDANKDNAMLQNQLAWELATRPDIKERDMAVLEVLATRANDAAEGEDAAILDTLARVQFMAGKKEEALKTQQKAITKADDDLKEQLQKTLDSYKEGKLPEVR